MTNIISNLGVAGNIIGVVAGNVPVFFCCYCNFAKVFLQLDPYLTKVKPVIAGVDDLLDSILLEWDNNTLNTVNYIVGQIRDDLKRAGYKMDDIDDQKITNHAKAELKRQAESSNGLSINTDDNGGLKINYKKEF